ncbi:MAG: phospho-N-acetylmuramoyl-pentapeptide-transferase [Flavobacteriales bacterium]|nr:phospho-N-acetylmuramoyl-pentapeptide-transferase [Flavobacteriales bacterium]|tara:strand:- start:7268 stop:8515 length:1248 start_codon:yes stop_codon:yes gene_type:complete
MLHYLFDLFYVNSIDSSIHNLFNYISVRSALAIIISLFVTIYFGGIIIKFLRKKTIQDQIRDLGLSGQVQKQGTPTMGGLIILLGILIPTIMFCRLNNIYIIIMIIATFWIGLIGFIDDYIKVFKKDKKGLAGKFKIIGQVFIGLIVSFVMFFHPGVVVQENIDIPHTTLSVNMESYDLNNELQSFHTKKKSLTTTIPFFKNNQLDYSDILGTNFSNSILIFIIFSFIVIFIITGVSNSANLTDGIDGLATGCSAIIGATLAVFCYVSGNMIFADYLDIMYIPDIGELVIFMSAFVGSCVGFLWYNSYPAQVFMGDTGSLALGGIIGIVAVLVRKELLLPIFCGIFFIQSLSVIIQVTYFKYTRKKYGLGQRIFLMSPLHHHYQKKGIHESKIVTRFWIICVFLCLLAFVTLKLR